MESKDETLAVPGYDQAILGVIEEPVPRLVYGRIKMLEILTEDLVMTFMEALEYLDFNVWSTQSKPGWPIFVWEMSSENARHWIRHDEWPEDWWEDVRMRLDQ